LGHHMRNRSDDEAFDFYFEGESALWRWLQLYGTLTGFFWITIALSNIISVFAPWLLLKPVAPFDRSTMALQDSLNPRYFRWIQIEAAAIFLVHGMMLFGFATPLWKYLLLLASFGVLWSAMQYAHHFGTERHVLRGARNLKTFPMLDWIWLNHNWHLNHHRQPTVPWIYLPHLDSGTPRGSLMGAYLAMWRGPRFTAERVTNLFTGKVVE
ncbi:MAG: fatty acid desaturase, partial [Bryobacteraceae bacterium]